MNFVIEIRGRLVRYIFVCYARFRYLLTHPAGISRHTLSNMTLAKTEPISVYRMSFDDMIQDMRTSVAETFFRKRILQPMTMRDILSAKPDDQREDALTNEKFSAIST